MILNSDEPLFNKIERSVSNYLDVLAENPIIPGFILHELAHNQKRIGSLIRGTGINPQFFIAQIYREIEAGNIKNCDPRQLIINMLSMCIFPFVAKPILQAVFLKTAKKSTNNLLQSAKPKLPVLSSHPYVNSRKRKSFYPVNPLKILPNEGYSFYCK